MEEVRWFEQLLKDRLRQAEVRHGRLLAEGGTHCFGALQAAKTEADVCQDLLAALRLRRQEVWRGRQEAA